GLSEEDVCLQFADKEAAELLCGVPALHDVTPSSFISAGLDLEAEQAEEGGDNCDEDQHEAPAARYVAGRLHIEALLRDAQGWTGLVGLWNKLHIKSQLLVYKKYQTRHQGLNTRARTIVTRNESKIRLSSEKYQCAWEAM
ncbi:hypothetical protein B0H17DRAFT_870728, partial [Mycena rosella]